MMEVPKIASKDHILQSTGDQTLNILMPQIVEQLVNVPEIFFFFQDRIQRRPAEQIADISSLAGCGGACLQGFLPGQGSTAFR